MPVSNCVPNTRALLPLPPAHAEVCLRVLMIGPSAWRPLLADRLRCFGSIEIRDTDHVDRDAVFLADAAVIVDVPEAGSRALEHAVAARPDLPWVPVIRHAREIWIGPLLFDGARDSEPDSFGGCARCAVLHASDREADSEPVLGADEPWLSDIASRLVLACCQAADSRGFGVGNAAVITCIDIASGQAESLEVPRHPACALCAQRRAKQGSAREQARQWGLRIASAEEAQVGQPLPARLPALRRFTGARFGLLDLPRRRPPEAERAIRQFCRSRGADPESVPLARSHAFSVACHTWHGGSRTTRLTEGFDFDDAAQAEALAIVEGLERRFVQGECDPARIEWSRMKRDDDTFVDPRTCVSYSAAQLADPGFPLRRFDPDDENPWLWGIDLCSGEPCRVALDLVVRNHGPDAAFAANSTGAACHSDVCRAIANGILETVERDAFMLAWLRRRSLPRITFGAGDPDPGALRVSFGRLGLSLCYVDITTDLGIPTVLGVLRDTGDPDFLLVDMVAAPDGSRAIAKLHRELAQFAAHHFAAPGCLANDCTRSADPDTVMAFPDHAAFYQRADRHPLAAFLTASSEVSRCDWSAQAQAMDAGAELAQLVLCLRSRGYRVVAVDCTPPLLAAAGLHAVKVLIPELQPLNAGHRLRALGGKRLRSQVGAGEAPFAEADLNPWPHPFW